MLRSLAAGDKTAMRPRVEASYQRDRIGARLGVWIKRQPLVSGVVSPAAVERNAEVIKQKSSEYKKEK